MGWFEVLLFFHLFGAIVGIGPTFAFGHIFRLGASSPGHGPFATRVVHAVASKLSIPLAALVLLSGLGLIAEARYDLLATGWLVTSIVLFLGAFGYSVFFQNRILRRILSLADGAGTAGEDPPAELLRLRRSARRGGTYLRTSAVVILVLMIFKPF